MYTANWLEPNPIPRNLRAYSPCDEFERGLRDFREGRGAELEDEILPDWKYYGPKFRSQLESTVHCFRIGEQMRAGIREGILDESDFYVDAKNYPAHAALENTAYRLGWRVVARAYWAAAKTGHPSIARDVENACRELVDWMQAIWQNIVRLPDNRRNRESQRAQVEPLLLRAKVIASLLEERLDRMGC